MVSLLFAGEFETAYSAVFIFCPLLLYPDSILKRYNVFQKLLEQKMFFMGSDLFCSSFGNSCRSGNYDL